MTTIAKNNIKNIKKSASKSKVSKILNEIDEHNFNAQHTFNQAFDYPTDDLHDNPTIVNLITNAPPISENEKCKNVLKLFQKNLSLFAIPVVDKNKRPIGIVERIAFVELFVQPYTKELFGKQIIAEYMNPEPLIVDKNIAVDDVARIIIDAGMQHMVNGFIATENDQYLGIANGLDLLNEITIRKQNHLFHLAHFDQLTKLPNRTLFLDRLSMAITQSERDHTRIGLLFIDLDNFKHFNDSMGHSVGDQILIEAATRLSNSARESDTVSRLSGDEFTIILNGIESDEDVEVLCNRILSVLNEPLHILEREMFMTASIGFATYPDDDTDMTGLLIKADAAMYEAKRSGRNAYKQYVPGMHLYSLDHMALETDLRLALEHGEFELYYQPKIKLSTGEVVGNEALIRWNHPKRGLLTPIHFIDIIEKTGLIIPIGKWILQEACMQQMRWIESGLKPMCISVNISAMQFYQADFCQVVEEIIHTSGIKPEHLTLELTETLCMTDVVTVLKNLQDLHTLGIKLAIDDFGTGYSNLSYLKKFPIDSLKIDQSFIRNIEKEPVNVGIVTAIAALGKSMSLELVAEGVETDDEMQLAEACGCEFVQGYRFSKPLPAIQLAKWLTSYTHNISYSSQNITVNNRLMID
jgi:diguanylate cyclase (GGDEF)-like protein